MSWVEIGFLTFLGIMTVGFWLSFRHAKRRNHQEERERRRAVMAISSMFTINAAIVTIAPVKDTTLLILFVVSLLTGLITRHYKLRAKEQDE